MKNNVYISNGLKVIHTGVIGEDKIDEGMNEFISLYNSKVETFTKMILCHFIFEYIHPFYDGNGRFGRYLFSNGLYLETNSYISFLVSSAFSHFKNKYYKSFKEAVNKYEFGCLNAYVDELLSILIKEVSDKIEELQSNKENIKNIKPDIDMSKSEMKIYNLISETSILSDYGISNDEIINETGVSKRTLVYALNKFEENKLLEHIKIGRFTYHKLKL